MSLKRKRGLLLFCCVAFAGCQVAMASYTIVERNNLHRSYPPMPGYYDLANEVYIGPNGEVTFQTGVAAFDGQSSTIYFISTTETVNAVPLTVRYGGSNAGSKNICISVRTGLENPPPPEPSRRPSRNQISYQFA